MDAPFVGEFLGHTLRTLAFISPISLWSALRKVRPRPRTVWAKRIPQPVAAVILFAFIAWEIYWASPDPAMLGSMAALFLTIPLERLIVFVNGRICHPAQSRPMRDRFIG